MSGSGFNFFKENFIYMHKNHVMDSFSSCDWLLTFSQIDLTHLVTLTTMVHLHLWAYRELWWTEMACQIMMVSLISDVLVFGGGDDLTL